MTLSVAREVGNGASFLDDTHAQLKVRGVGVYADPFIMVRTSYALAAISIHIVQMLSAFCPDQSGSMICA
jgi:hypothetical protein